MKCKVASAFGGVAGVALACVRDLYAFVLAEGGCQSSRPRTGNKVARCGAIPECSFAKPRKLWINPFFRRKFTNLSFSLLRVFVCLPRYGLTEAETLW